MPIKNTLVFLYIFFSTATTADYKVSNEPSQGVTLYRQYVSGGQPDYVLKLDLKYVDIHSAFGPSYEANFVDRWNRSDQDVSSYGGNNPRFHSQSLRNFKMPDGASPLAVSSAALGGRWPENCTYCSGTLTFPMRVNGKLFTEGYGAPDGARPDDAGGSNVNNYLVFCADNNSGKADITPYRNLKTNPSCSHEIVSVTKDVSLGAEPGPRTFIGVSDSNNDGYDEVLIFSTKLAYNNYAYEQLKSAPFNAREAMQLDGGGSSQLVVNGDSAVSSTRPLWNALVVGVKSQTLGQLTEKDKSDIVFDWIESHYGQYFSNGSKTRRTPHGYYRVYPREDISNYIYSYKGMMWYKIGGKWIQGSSLENWYQWILNKK